LIEDKCSVDLGADHNQLIGHGAKRKMEIYWFSGSLCTFAPISFSHKILYSRGADLASALKMFGVDLHYFVSI
jgi:hypothetical protein